MDNQVKTRVVYSRFTSIFATLLVLTIVVFMGGVALKNNDGLVMFEKEGGEIPAKQLKVLRSIDSKRGIALVSTKIDKSDKNEYDYSQALPVLLISDGLIRDFMTFDFTKDMHLIQVGTYKYETADKEDGQDKTIPAVKIKTL